MQEKMADMPKCSWYRADITKRKGHSHMKNIWQEFKSFIKMISKGKKMWLLSWQPADL